MMPNYWSHLSKGLYRQVNVSVDPQPRRWSVAAPVKVASVGDDRIIGIAATTLICKISNRTAMLSKTSVLVWPEQADC